MKKQQIKTKRTITKTLWNSLRISSVALSACVFLAQIASINAAQPRWTQLSPSGLTFPLLRFGSTTVYDPISNRIILFSGGSDDGAAGNPRLNDVWILTNANGLGGAGTWSNLIPNGAPGSPPVRFNQSAVYDSANNRMIIFGGCEGGCLPVVNDVWVLSNANGVGGSPTWTQLSPTGVPPAARQSHQAIYDPSTNSMILWAGQNGGGSECGTFSDVWVLSHANGLGGTPNWTQLSPPGGPPAGQYNSSAVYDSANNILIVFGGFGFVGATCQQTNAVWALSNANGTGGTPVWSNLVAQGAAGSPANRFQHVAIYESSSNTMTIFGGDGTTGFLGDTWLLSHANGIGGTPAWRKLLNSGAPGGPVPSSRFNGVGVDTVNNRMIMFGGGFLEGGLWSTWVLTHPNGL
jgi:galactose oxidase-like protein